MISDRGPDGLSSQKMTGYEKDRAMVLTFRPSFGVAKPRRLQLRRARKSEAYTEMGAGLAFFALPWIPTQPA